MIGKTLGPYRVVAKLGQGGMGEVYRAHDARLHRDVAIKVLPDLFAADPERIARFEREAQALAALNHPNIAHLYGVEGSALVMELVEGDDLAERVSRGPLAYDDALGIARQIAEALESAHEHGIVHRDLKPANIKLTTNGTAKVLDFGLARALDPGAEADPADSPTLTGYATRHGVLLGTAAYMAPEQARGHAADRRADIWAFGCVLYEMLTGRRAFGGDTATDTLAAIMRADPDWSALPPETTSGIKRLLRRCLEKDRRRRLAAIGDARLDLEDAPDEDTPLAGPSAVPRRRVIGMAVLVAAGGLAGTLAAWAFLRPVTAPPAVSRLQATLPPEAAMAINTIGVDLAIARDGSRIAYIAQPEPTLPPQLFVRFFDRGDTIALAGTELAASPFFSPDGEMLAFSQNNNLVKMPVRGGTPITICRLCSSGLYGGAWGFDETIVFAPVGGTLGIKRIRPDGEALADLTHVDRSTGESRHGFVSILPGNRAILFTVYRSGNVPPDIAVLELATGRQRVLVAGGSHPQYLPSGFLVFATTGALHAVPFDLTRLEVVGAARPVVDRVVTKSTGPGDYAVSDTGTLVYASGDPLGPSDTIAWVGRDGREEPVRVPAHDYAMIRVSPDGQQAVLDARDEDLDLWLWSFARGTLQRLTFDVHHDQYPVWTRDGERIIFAGGPGSSRGLFSMPPSGGAERLTTNPRVVLPTTISPDGRWIVGNGSGTANTGLTMVSTEPGHAERRVPDTPADASNADISPDGRWIAYQSAASGRSEIYVQPFPGGGGARRQVTTDQGTSPVWARTGRELFYLDARRRLMSIPIETAPAFAAGNPTLALDRVRVMTPGRSFDVSADAQRFLVIKDPPANNQQIRHLEIVLNWGEELKRPR